ncbi:FAD-binding protein, partial [Streptomyces sp. NPDC059956]|uniref:FAD-binding protein n=1 Tax=Streptomyces sp. NPDC059956 TaxID=3347015 RepID=UPI003656118B
MAAQVHGAPSRARMPDLSGEPDGQGRSRSAAGALSARPVATVSELSRGVSMYDDLYDVIVIGAGAAGLTAATMLGRSMRNTLVISKP